MNEQELQQQIVLLVQLAMQGDQQATQLIQQIMLAALLGNQLAVLLALIILQVAQQMQLLQVRAAKFGAKLNYIKQLRGECPEGYEVQYYSSGGKPCVKCNKKNLEMPSTVIEQFKMSSAKCGKKMKKKACGGNLKKRK